MTHDCQQLLAVTAAMWINVNLDSTMVNAHTDAAHARLCALKCASVGN